MVYWRFLTRCQACGKGHCGGICYSLMISWGLGTTRPGGGLFVSVLRFVASVLLKLVLLRGVSRVCGLGERWCVVWES